MDNGFPFRCLVPFCFVFVFRIMLSGEVECVKVFFKTNWGRLCCTFWKNSLERMFIRKEKINFDHCKWRNYKGIVHYHLLNYYLDISIEKTMIMVKQSLLFYLVIYRFLLLISIFIQMRNYVTIICELHDHLFAEEIME